MTVTALDTRRRHDNPVALNAVRHGILSDLPVLPGIERAEAWRSHLEAITADLQPTGAVESALAERIALTLWRLGRVARHELALVVVLQDRAEHDVCGEDRGPGLLPDLRHRRERYTAWLETIGMWRQSAPDSAADAAAVAELIRTAARISDVEIFGDGDRPADVTFPDYPDGAALEGVPWTAGHALACLDVIARASRTNARAESEEIEDLLQRQIDLVDTRIADMQGPLANLRERRLLPNPRDRDNIARYESHLDRCLYRALHELQRLRAARETGHITAPPALDVMVTVDDGDGA